MTKEEKIKEAYGEYWDLVKDLVRNNGSLSESVWRGSEIDLQYQDYSTGYFRPKSLQGIENNNGWIKIESESDLPIDNESYWTVIEGVKNSLFQTYSNHIVLKHHTHYQPIIKPEPPIY